MEWLLIRYLVVTGIGATIAINVPGLVVAGFFMLILPGLILSLMPTAFLWGLAFALLWWPLKMVVGDWPAAALALAGAAAALWWIPTAANRIIDTRIDADRAGDKDATGPIEVQGIVRIQRTDWKVVDSDSAKGKAWFDWANAESKAGRKIDWARRPLACDALCAATLFTPGVEAVIFSPLPKQGGTVPSPVMFRITRVPGCQSIDVGAPHSSGLEGWGKNAEALQGEWRAAIAAGACIVREPVREKADMIITVRNDFIEPLNRKARWPLTDRSRRVSQLTIANRAGLLLQRTMVETSRLAVPLWVEGSGDLSSFSFGWGRLRLSDGRQPGYFKPIALLAKLTPLRLEGDPAAAAIAARAQLTALLDDPARPAADPGFALSDVVLREIGDKGVAPGDAELIDRIVADPRTRNLDGIWSVIGKLGDDAARLRGPIVTRLLRAEAPDTDANRTLGKAIERLPAGLFANTTIDELALLADPARRAHAPGLIRRQADRGVEAVPLLLGMLEDIFRRRTLAGKQSGPELEQDAADAINHALGVLGPGIAFARPRLEAALASRTEREGRVQSWGWEVTLVRMGRAPESFEKPSWSGNTVADYHRNLRRDVERFERDLDEARRRRNA